MKRSFFAVLNNPMKSRGQILLEVLIAMAAVATLSATIAALVIVAQRGQKAAKRRDAAANIAAEVFAALTSIADADIPAVSQGYNRLYCPPDGICEDGGYPEITGKNPADSNNRYRPILVGNNFDLMQGEAAEQLAGFDFKYYLTVENVCRSSGGDIVGTWIEKTFDNCDDVSNGYGAGSVDDPYTQKVTATFTSPDTEDMAFGRFITRSRSKVMTQSSWSGAVVADGSGAGVIKFTIFWDNDDDDDGATDPAKIFLCRSKLQPLNLECPAGEWTETSSFVSVNPATLYYSPIPADVGVNEYWIYVCDIAGQCSNSNNGGAASTWSNHGTFTVN